MGHPGMAHAIGSEVVLERLRKRSELHKRKHWSGIIVYLVARFPTHPCVGIWVPFIYKVSYKLNQKE
jgi:hypothetical protein